MRFLASSASCNSIEQRYAHYYCLCATFRAATSPTSGCASASTTSPRCAASTTSTPTTAISTKAAWTRRLVLRWYYRAGREGLRIAPYAPPVVVFDIFCYGGRKWGNKSLPLEPPLLPLAAPPYPPRNPPRSPPPPRPRGVNAIILI